MIHKCIRFQEEDEGSMETDGTTDWGTKQGVLLLLSFVSYSRRGPIRDASLYTRLLLTFVIIF